MSGIRVPKEGKEVVVAMESNAAVETKPVLKPSVAVNQTVKKGEVLVGCYVGKGEDGVGGVLLGKVLSFKAADEIYDVIYEDGCRERLDFDQFYENLKVHDECTSGMKMSVRKRKLDLLASSGCMEVEEQSQKKPKLEDVSDANGEVTMEEALSKSRSHSNGSDDDGDSGGNSNECGRVSGSAPDEGTANGVHIPELPQLSDDIPVPDDCVSHLFSVYNFLRSFSVELFLSPFGLDDFIGSLNCPVQNSLMDSVHLALMRALKRHLEALAAEGSKVASKCLRYEDWTLLDQLTWPTFLLSYLSTMGYMKQLGGKAFGLSLVYNEYYRLPSSTKLKVLQILCDDVMDSVELRSELESREGYDEETQFILEERSLNEQKSCVTRRTKTSACKDSENFQRTHGIEASKGSNQLNAPGDGNSDECRLCGMDGMLLCCDGCPEAYHARCIGLSKLSIPEGLWFCPECTVNRLGPTTSRIERGAKGAVFFGVDPSGLLFLGTCNYMLVIGTSPTGEPFSRYYNQDNVATILSALSAAEFATTYEHICKGISDYWGIQPLTRQSGLPDCENNASNNVLPCLKPDVVAALVGRDINNVEIGCSGDNAESIGENKLIVAKNELCQEGQVALSSSFDPAKTLQAEELVDIGAVQKISPTSHKPVNGSMLPGLPKLQQAITSEKLTLQDVRSLEDRQINHQNPEQCKSLNGKITTKKSAFKPQAYINQYAHGDVAATAAANLAVLTSENSKVIDSKAGSVYRKQVLANIALQTKAFASAVHSFMWPTAEKKITDIPRDRCGWCLVCRGEALNKKGCLLNFAATNALRGSARNMNNFRPVKYDESHLPSIVAHVTNMEESLHGLLDGSLADPAYKQQWRTQVKEASNLRILKFLLLELEKSIRGIVFCAGWFKLADDWWSVDFNAPGCPSHVGMSQKRSAAGKRGRRRLLPAESADMPSDNSWKEGQWCFRGKLLRYVLQRGCLNRPFVRKAARQGGSKRIAVLTYSENSDCPRRSRQTAWRASVEMSKSTSHLALQVRYLDAHIRWRDLALPDQVPSEGKGSDADSFAFRNAVICDKRKVENKIFYALKFPNQKHLPLRVTKNVLEEENDEKGGKLWFSETHIPLYLIKTFEEKAAVKPSTGLRISSRPHTLRTKKCHDDIFSFLRQKVGLHSCVLCTSIFLSRDAAQCSSCLGFFHKDCPLYHFSEQVDGSNSKACCKSCHDKLIAQSTASRMVLGIRLPDQSNVQTPKLTFRLRIPQSKIETQVQPQRVKAVVAASNSLHKKSKSGPQKFGLIWKKRNVEDTGKDFRMKNILLKSSIGMTASIRPVCHLCSEPYQPDLMYICCEKCLHWFHADALQLEESQIFELIGFKCCKCRRIRIPLCPHDKNYVSKKQKMQAAFSVHGNAGSASDVPLFLQPGELPDNTEISVQHDDPLLSFSDRVELIGEDISDSELDSYLTMPSSRNQDKLSVRRASAKHVVDFEDGNTTNGAQFDSQQRTYPGDSNGYAAEEAGYMDTSEASSTLLEWEFSHLDSFAGLLTGDANPNCQWNESRCENAEYEPQTYFSFTELLASEDTEDPTSVALGRPAIELLTGGSNKQASTFDETSRAVTCDKCKLQEPSPDLECEICELHIHSHCSPWEESAIPQDAKWRCGDCREWR